ncbi:hypothetical protein NMH_1967 [Neisseria meningitidis H44/76]|uniref:Uncharacterized protein n=2 Tax=Neisseria meningitidis TaxID=487 RepID=E6MYW8_NEIMH|nr:hypothetical protein NMH_1967 [Neisseria meningitidis H44/76]
MPSEDEGSTFCPVPTRLPFYAAPPFADNIAHFFISTDFPLSVKILSHLSTTGYTQVQDKACGDWGFSAAGKTADKNGGTLPVPPFSNIHLTVHQELSSLNVGGLFAFRAGGYVERDALAFFQGFETFHIDC